MAIEATRMTGIVSRFSNQKGYGFIKPDNGTKDVFVHQSEIKSEGFRSLYEGQKVEFIVTGNGDKYQAVDVTGPAGASLDGGRNGCNGGGRVNNHGGDGFGSNRRNGNGNFRSGGGGGGGAECYSCGRIGHMSRDCDRERNGGGACYTCGMTGHIAKDCDRSGGVVGGAGSGGGGGGACYTCGMMGHIARDCDRSGGDRNAGGGGGACYTCGMTGHMAKDCDRSDVGTGGGGCYNCGGLGHLARDCPSERRGGGGGGGSSGACYNCGLPGHLSRDCESGSGSGGGFRRSGGSGGGDRFGRTGGGGGSKCFNCGEAGHFARECTSPAVNQKSSGGSYDSASDGPFATSHGVLTNTPLPFLTSLIITILAAVWHLRQLPFLEF